MEESNENHEYDVINRPSVGTGLSVAAGLSFFLMSMVLPLVGPAGAPQPHYAKNKAAFLMVLLLTFTLAALASWSKLGRRKVDGSPLPWFSLGLSAVCVIAFFVLMAGGFAI